MPRRKCSLALAAFVAIALAGCGSSAPAHKTPHYHLVPGYAPSAPRVLPPAVHAHAPQLKAWATELTNDVAAYRSHPNPAALHKLYNENQVLARATGELHGTGPAWTGEMGLAVSDVNNAIILIAAQHKTAEGAQWLNRGVQVAQSVQRDS